MSAKKKGTVQKTTEELEMEEMEGGVDAVVVSSEEIQDYQINLYEFCMDLNNIYEFKGDFRKRLQKLF